MDGVVASAPPDPAREAIAGMFEALGPGVTMDMLSRRRS
jgi:hypothetical protein